MVVLQNVLLALLGFSGGIGVAGGVFAFISVLQLIPRLACRLGLATYTYQTETWIFLGGSIGTVIQLFSVPLPIGTIGLAVSGIFFGIFTGALSMALADTLQVIPILAQRTKLVVGLPWLIVAMGLGRAVGAFFQMCF